MGDTTLGNNTNDPTLNFFNLPPPSQMEGGTTVTGPDVPGIHKHQGQGTIGVPVDSTEVAPSPEQVIQGKKDLANAIGDLYAVVWQTNNINSQDPAIPHLSSPSAQSDAIMSAAANVATVVQGNPWLAGNALTAIWVGMVECMDMTKDMKYIDAKLKITMEVESWLLAKGNAELTLQKGQQQFEQNILKAVITAAVGVATCVVSWYTPSMMGLGGAGASALGAGKIVGTFELLKAVGNSLGNVVDAFYAQAEAQTDAAKIIKEAVKQAIDRLVDDLGSSVKDNQQFYDQLAQKLTDLIQQLKKAFEKQG